MVATTARDLRDQISIKAVRNLRQGYRVEEGSFFRPEVKLGLERARLLTEAYQRTDGEPMVLRRAKALEHILLNMTIYIQDWERIVGNYAESPEALMWPVERNWKSVHRLIQGEGASLVNEADMGEFNRIVDYWKGKTLSDRREKAFAGSPDLDKYWKYEGTVFWTHWSELGVINYEKVLQKGLNGIIEEALAKLEEIGRTIPPDYVKQKDFLEAVVISLRAAITWAGRYAQEARELSKAEKSEERRKQLESIADACERVPAHPARTLQEAFQSFFFVHLITHQIEYIRYGCGVRFDLVMNPYYQRDLKEGRITREEALDLILKLRLKFEEFGQVYSPTVSALYGGVQTLQAILIGGVDSQGRDVTNEMSYLVLDSVCELPTIQPSVGLRVHDGTPKKILLRAIDVAKTGVGYPAFFNDKVLIPLLMKWGCPLEDARNYSISACVYLDIPGKNIIRRVVSYFSFPKCLWWALHQGIDPKTGDPYGASTPDPAHFSSIEDVMEAYLEQVRFFCVKQFALEDVLRSIYQEYLPCPFESAMIDGCIERGQGYRWWTYPARVPSHPVAVGTTNVADSLAAIKKAVFDEQRISMEELIEVLDKNWEGHEDLRRMMLAAPKFGNDDDAVDLLARAVHHRTEQVVEAFSDNCGAGYHLDGSGVSATYGMSLETPATPDGRKDGGPFSDATLSPAPGADVKGPTAVLKSCSKIDILQSFNQLLNQKFLPQFLEGDSKEAFYHYLRTWADLGISHIQFNVVDKATLLDAQKYPEKHKALTVRVAGYSAYFIDLSKGLQDHIISRVEQGLS
jgi:formate C-acetyltransferase